MRGSRQGVKGRVKGARTWGVKERVKPLRSRDLLEVTAEAEACQPHLNLGLDLGARPTVAAETLPGELGRVLGTQAGWRRLGDRGERCLGVAVHTEADCNLVKAECLQVRFAER